MHPCAFLLVAALLVSCDHGNDDTGPAPADTDTDVDTDADTDTGQAAVWTDARVDTEDSLTGVYAFGLGVVAVSSGGRIWNYRQATGWDDEDAGLEGEALNDIWGFGAGDTLEYFAVGGAGKWIHFYSGGWITDDLGKDSLEAVGGPTAQLLYAVGWGSVYRWDGYAWTEEAVPPGAQINEVWADADVAYAVGEDGLILQRVNSEQGWEAMTSPTKSALFAVGGDSGEALWAVGEEGTVLRFDGDTWTEQARFTDQTLWDVRSVGADAVFAVGHGGAAFRWDGGSWTELATGVDDTLNAVHGLGASDVWAVGEHGTAIHYTGG